MLWLIFSAMAIVATAFAVIPLFRTEKTISARLLIVAVVVLGVAFGMYSKIGTPDAQSVEAGGSVDDMLVGLEKRLQTDQDDLEGWRMLARSYAQLGRYNKAASAYEHIIKLENGTNSMSLSDFGEALFAMDNNTLSGRAGELFESALAIDANNTKALFYAGMSAARKGDKDLAIKRWELFLLQTQGEELPEGLSEFLHQQIADLKGESVESPQAEQPVAQVESNAVVSLDLLLGAGARETADPDAKVWIIARDPDQPNPPIAVVVRSVADLPAKIALGDANAMIEGRPLSGFSKIELIARVATSGSRQAVSGDWFGSKLVIPAENNEVSITIDQQVP